MPSAVLLYVAAAAIVGSLAVAPLAPDVRPIELIALAAAATYVLFGRQSPRFRAIVITTLVLYATHAAVERRDARDVTPRRTARYAATLLAREPQTDGSTQARLSLDDGTSLSARM